MGFEHDKRIIVYPNYIDAKKTMSEGRRIPRSTACDSPNVGEIADSCNRGLGLAAEIEVHLRLSFTCTVCKAAFKTLTHVKAKFYSRDFLVPGRVRVKLFSPDGKPINAAIPNRRTLYLRIAQLVPKHPGRSEKARAQAAAKSVASSSQASSSKSGKKGKKGRK